MSFKKTLFIIAISLIAILSACNGNSTKDKIYNHLEEAVTLEKGFEDQQGEITKLEIKERELYDQIIDLGMDEFDEIKELSKQAIATIEKRSDQIKLEKESINASEEEFEKAKELISKLDDEQVVEKAEEMYDVMINRYSKYDILYKAYTNSLTLEKELYTILQEEDAEQEKLVSHIAKVNDSYQKVLEANEEFNKDTKAYNTLKKEFYSVANIEIKYEEDSSSDSKDD